MSALTRALSVALVDFLWQGTLVGLLLWVALVALRNRSVMVPLSVKSCVLAGGVRSTVSGDKTASGPISTDPDAHRQRDS